MRRQSRNSLVLLLAVLAALLLSRAARADCSDPPATAGQVAYNNDVNVPQYCNGTDWIRMGSIVYSSAAIPTTSGLVGYWKLDDTGTTATDSSPTGAHGTLTSFPASGIWTTGPIDGALEFDKDNDNNDYINIPYNAALNLTSAGGTVAGWFKADVKAGQDSDWTIFRKAYHGNTATWAAYALTGFQSLANDPMYLNAIFASGGISRAHKGATVITTGVWHHAAMTWDTGSVKLYLDGALDYSSSNGPSITYSGSTGAWIGQNKATGFSFADGMIDDVRVYNRPLTQTEITELHEYMTRCIDPAGPKGGINYNQYSRQMMFCNGADWVAMGPKGPKTPGVPAAGALVSQWKLDDAGMGAWAPSGGHIDGTVQFDGTNDHIEVAGGFQPTGDFTYSAWVNITGNDDTVAGFSGSNEFLFHIDASRKLVTYTNGSARATSTAAIPQNTWTHVVTLRSAGTITQYINNAPDGTGSDAGALDNTCQLLIGTESDSGCASSLGNRFAGLLDDFRIYGRALTTAEITDLFTGGTDPASPLAHWKLDESTGTVAADDANGHDGELKGTAISTADSAGSSPGILTNGPISQSDESITGNALFFDGIDDYVNIPSAIALANNSFTLSAWAKRNSTGSQDIIFGQGTGSNYNGLQFGFRNTNYFYCGFWGDFLDSAQTYPEVDTLWHHLACTYDAAVNKLVIYRDGEWIAEKTTAGDYAGAGASRIGGFTWGTGSEFNGWIDEVLVYSSALSAAEILELYGQPGSCSNPAGSEGVLVYNTSFNVMQYCNGTAWRRMGK